jgi:hypothetical protein
MSTSSDIQESFGRYRLDRRLATGGMAEIFLASQEGPGGFHRDLVIKRILPHLTGEPGFVDMFLDEAKLAARLSHPNIVPIFDFGEVDGAYFLAMELVRGPDLRSVLDASRAVGETLPFPILARIVADAAAGLEFAHRLADADGNPLHIIHRDVSPSNIIVSYDGITKVLDFGIAKADQASHKTRTGFIKGKLSYMPPEQVQGEKLDARADVYALGVVLYELCTGRVPFSGESDFKLMQSICETPPPAPTSLSPGVPEPLEAIILQAMAKDREARFPSARAMATALERYVVSADPPVGTFEVGEALRALKGRSPEALDVLARAGVGTGSKERPSSAQQAAPPAPAAAEGPMQNEATHLGPGLSEPSAPAAKSDADGLADQATRLGPRLSESSDPAAPGPGGGAGGGLSDQATRLGPRLSESSDPAAPGSGGGAGGGLSDQATRLGPGLSEVTPEAPAKAAGGPPRWLLAAGGVAAIAAVVFVVATSFSDGDARDPTPLGTTGAQTPPATAEASAKGAGPAEAPGRAGDAADPRPDEGTETQPDEGAVAASDPDASTTDPSDPGASRLGEATGADDDAAPGTEADPSPPAVAAQPEPTRPASPRETTPSAPPVRPRPATPSPSRPAQPAAAQTGFVMVQSQPWAEIHVGGESLGMTPRRIELPAGRHELRLHNPDAGLERRVTVHVRSGATERVSATLGEGRVAVLVRPYGEVFVGGRKRGVTPMPPLVLPAGRHQIEVVHPESGRRSTHTVNVVHAETHTLRVDLSE